jgi:hypothetical protein
MRGMVNNFLPMEGACQNEVVIGADFIQATVVKVLVVD